MRRDDNFNSLVFLYTILYTFYQNVNKQEQYLFWSRTDINLKNFELQLFERIFKYIIRFNSPVKIQFSYWFSVLVAISHWVNQPLGPSRHKPGLRSLSDVCSFQFKPPPNAFSSNVVFPVAFIQKDILHGLRMATHAQPAVNFCTLSFPGYSVFGIALLIQYFFLILHSPFILYFIGSNRDGLLSPRTTLTIYLNLLGRPHGVYMRDQNSRVPNRGRRGNLGPMYM